MNVPEDEKPVNRAYTFVEATFVLLSLYNVITLFVAVFMYGPILQLDGWEFVGMLFLCIFSLFAQTLWVALALYATHVYFHVRPQSMEAPVDVFISYLFCAQVSLPR
jgi:sterol desaturase/sphingolipid hydroxylase (fatty acid hydroxylase superfamily)